MNNNITIREQLMFKAGLQVVLLVASLAAIFLYALPKYDEIALQVEASNAAVERYRGISENGIAFSDLVSTLRREGGNEELIKLVTNSPENVKNIIKKTGNEAYLDWIANVLSSSDQDRALLVASRARINSIIPTLSPVSGNIDENSITLREYVTFVEQNILKKFSINSFAPLGIDGVKYQEEKSASSSENIIKTADAIGEFSVKIDFQDTANKNIADLLNYIDSLGEPSVLSESGTLLTPLPIMSNPLIVIDALILEKTLNPDAPNTLNKWSITLKFYMRGSSMDDKEYLRETFNKRKQELAEKIELRIKECSDDSSCVELERLKSVRAKFAQFTNSVSSTLSSANLNNVESVYVLGQQIHSLKSISQEFENIK